jgi:ABC-type protease/lipase transport system fused ATPase/permease subunit
MMSTHRSQLLEWADTVAVIEAGQCVLMGPKQEMIEKLSRGVDVKTAAPNGVSA